MPTNKEQIVNFSRNIAILRIVFGLMWSVDAFFKWSSSFRNSYINQIQSASQGQPSWLHPWFSFWIGLNRIDPHLFATLVAIIETFIALALVLGFARRFIYIAGTAFSLLIWSVAEGFGGPYTSASVDIGTAIIYAIVFIALYQLDKLSTPPSWAIDKFLDVRLSRWSTFSNPKISKKKGE